jgi:hypothetical protein
MKKTYSSKEKSTASDTNMELFFDKLEYSDAKRIDNHTRLNNCYVSLNESKNDILALIEFLPKKYKDDFSEPLIKKLNNKLETIDSFIPKIRSLNDNNNKERELTLEEQKELTTINKEAINVAGYLRNLVYNEQNCHNIFFKFTSFGINMERQITNNHYQKLINSEKKDTFIINNEISFKSIVKTSQKKERVSKDYLKSLLSKISKKEIKLFSTKNITPTLK